MSLIAEFHLSSSRLPLVATVAESNTSLKLDRVLTTDPEQPVLICWAETDSFEAFEAALDTNASVAARSVLETTSDERLYHLRLARPTLFSLKAAFVELGAAPDETTITSDGWAVRARLPDRETLARIRDLCIEHDIAFRLEALYEPTANRSDSSGLTRKQREALVLAHEYGYFQLPRDASLAELAEKLDLSPSSLSARLRRAERRVIDNALSSGDVLKETQ